MPSFNDYVQSLPVSPIFDMDDFLKHVHAGSHLNGKSLFSEILFPTFPDSSLAHYLYSCDRLEIVQRFLKTMGPTFVVLDLPLDHDHCHPLHYAMMSPDISLNQFKAILDLMILHGSGSAPFQDHSDINTKRRVFLDKFMQKYSGFSVLYAQYLQQMDVTSKQPKRVVSWLRKQTLPCEITKKYDFICRYVNLIQHQSESTIQYDAIIDIIQCVFSYGYCHTSPYRFMYSCPHMLTNLMLCVQRTLNCLLDGNVNPSYLPLHTKQGVECLRYDDSLICDHYRRLHAHIFPGHSFALTGNDAKADDVHSGYNVHEALDRGVMTTHHGSLTGKHIPKNTVDCYSSTSQRKSAQLAKIRIARQAQVESSEDALLRQLSPGPKVDGPKKISPISVVAPAVRFFSSKRKRTSRVLPIDQSYSSGGSHFTDHTGEGRLPLKKRPYLALEKPLSHTTFFGSTFSIFSPKCNDSHLPHSVFEQGVWCTMEKAMSSTALTNDHDNVKSAK